jgi:hypothetical protein
MQPGKFTENLSGCMKIGKLENWKKIIIYKYSMV